MGSEKDKLDVLAERIRKAEEAANPKKKSSEGNISHFVGYDFAGTLIGSVILGVLLDRTFETAPWCLIGAVTMGFSVGIMGVWNAIKKPHDEDKVD